MKKTGLIKLKRGKALVVKGKAKVRIPRPRVAAPARPRFAPRRRIAKGALDAHAREVYARLTKTHPEAHCELDHETPLQLLMATILSAQCTDKRVNMVTPALFRRYPDAQSLADANQEELEDIIRSTGFFHNKAKALMALGKALVERHGGEVPATMAELVQLPGVGRKTANVVLGNAFRTNEGVVVDTHVGRLSARLGLSRNTDPVKIEQELMPLFPQNDWAMLAHVLIFHGRRVCDAKAPKCEVCSLSDICPSSILR
ncbi:MAG TPA: endonuclease III [Gemmatimonadaceae bacterium]|nr:endonuclease III [Gemmatimonadaceae bacterium]